MRISIALLTFLLLSGCQNKNDSSVQVSQLRCNGFEDPAGTGNIPDFGWILKSDERNKSQTAYQIIVSSDMSRNRKNKGDIWDSGKIISGKSAWITYGGSALQPGREYFWRVRVWDEKDKPSGWSGTARFVTALFGKNDWEGAKWIGYEEIPDSLLLVPGVHGNGNNLGGIAVKKTIVPLFRKEFSRCYF